MKKRTKKSFLRETKKALDKEWHGETKRTLALELIAINLAILCDLIKEKDDS